MNFLSSAVVHQRQKTLAVRWALSCPPPESFGDVLVVLTYKKSMFGLMEILFFILEM